MIKAIEVLATIAAAVLLAGVLLRLVVPWALPRLLYHPEPLPEGRTGPAAWGYQGAEEVRFEAADGVEIHGWWFPAGRARREAVPRRGAAIYFHGNAGTITSRGDLAENLARLGLDVLLIDYRGYGASEGEPSEEGLYADAEAAWREVLERGAEPGEIVLFGNSLGSAVAVELAARVEEDPATGGPAGLVLIGPMPDTRTVGRALYPLVPGFLLTWEDHRYAAIDRIGEVGAPILFARGAHDRVIPREASRSLYEAAGEPRRWIDVPAAGHADVFAQPVLWESIAAFLDEVLRDR
ncbi:MAG: alpha/beta fold hydrolase [Gemmatimonadota bacterium]|nr:alpha/beta fold hydrolase [Gemmatimonadota bacterium]